MNKKREIILRSIVKSASHQFGEENVELQYQSEEEKTYGYVGDILIIRVPEVFMSNDKDIEYINKNLWVKIHIDTGLFYLAKSVFTIQEEKEFYIHSHANTNANFNPKRFYHVCLGKGPLNMLISEILAETNSVKLIKLWQIYMMQLQVFLATESTVGVPFKYIVNVLTRPNTRQSNSTFEYRYQFTGSLVESPHSNIILNNTARRILTEKILPIHSVVPITRFEGHATITSIKPVDKQSEYEITRNVLKVTEIYLEEYWKYVKNNPNHFLHFPDADTEAMVSSVPGMVRVILDKYNKLKAIRGRLNETSDRRDKHGVLLVFKGEPIITYTEEVSSNPELNLFVLSYRFYSHIINTVENIIKVNREYGKHYYAI